MVFTRTFWQLLIGRLAVTPFIVKSLHEVTVHHFTRLTVEGFIPGFLATLAAVTAPCRLAASTFRTIAYIDPVAVVFFGWTLFEETLEAMQLSGGQLIFLGDIFKTITAEKISYHQNFV